MFYGNIKKLDIANGDGVRVSLFVSGCRNCCPGCFQPETWDFCHGSLFTAATEAEILAALDKPFVSGLTVLGGEPFEPENQPEVLHVVQKFKEIYPRKTVWCYTGYDFEKDILAGKLGPWETTKQLLDLIDILVDGEFHLEEKDLKLRFRGSSNQRVIDVKKSLAADEIVLWDDNEGLFEPEKKY